MSTEENDNQTGPTNGELAELPTRAILAFAIRCTKRIQPLSVGMRQEEIVAIDNAISLSERFCAGTMISPDKLTSVGDRIYDLRLAKSNIANFLSEQLLKSVTKTAYVAHYASIESSLIVDEDEFELTNNHLAASTSAFNAMNHAIKCFQIKPSELIQALNSDYQKLRHKKNFLLRAKNPIGSAINLSKASWLGPLWLHKEPEWYTIQKQELDDKLAIYRKENSEKKSEMLPEGSSESSIEPLTTLAELEKDVQQLASKIDGFGEKLPDLISTEFTQVLGVIEKRVAELTSQLENTESSAKSLSEGYMSLQNQVSVFSQEMATLEVNFQSHQNVLNENLEAFKTTQIKTVDKLGASSEEVKKRQAVVEKEAEASSAKVEEFLKTAQETLKRKVIVEGPIKFWKDKATNHNIWFALYSIITLTAGSAGVSILFRYWKALFGSDDVKSWQIGSILFAATVLLLLLRVLTRITLSNLHLATEAAERRVMMETYLGLMSQDKLKDEQDRSLILNALFRSSTTGLIKEEAVPASVLDLATRIASQGTKK